MNLSLSRIVAVLILALAWAMDASANPNSAKPNVVIIFIDDMGFADPSCFGNPMIETPNIDKLAADGVMLTNFYVNSPICSASRTALTTGNYPGRWNIHSYLESRKANTARGMAHFLDPKAPTTARLLRQNGYATAHYGKWHMGGGRDVQDAPEPKAYGYTDSWVDRFEGMGPGMHHREMPRQEATDRYVDHAIAFMQEHKDEPFFIRVCPNDVHDPFVPKQVVFEKHKDLSENPYVQSFLAVLDNLDTQIGRLVDEVETLGLTENTLIIFTSDNGPTDWDFYYKKNLPPPGFTGPFYGRKWSLYEGGIRMPFIARWKGTIPAGTQNSDSVVAAIDLMPTIAALAGVDVPASYKNDGYDMSEALLGKSQKRPGPVFWQYGAPHARLKPGKVEYRSPSFAIRDGDFKLLINPDGTDIKLFNLAKDPGETTNLAQSMPAQAKILRGKLRAWVKDMGYEAAGI